jgi:hypothetical protein
MNDSAFFWNKVRWDKWMELKFLLEKYFEANSDKFTLKRRRRINKKTYSDSKTAFSNIIRKVNKHFLLYLKREI